MNVALSVDKCIKIKRLLYDNLVIDNGIFKEIPYVGGYVLSSYSINLCRLL